MRIRASILTTAKAVGVLVALSAGAACSHPSGKLMVDSPRMLPYSAPDVDEITGIDSSEEEETEVAGSGSAQTQPQK